jgi:SAM-dependent methyltransferase
MPAPELHPAAAGGFARSADAYERGRPDYPSAAIDWLVERLGLGPGRTVVDLAAGTGKLSRPLAASGAEVVAVEPVAEMRAAIGPGVRALAGVAEAIPLPDASADAVTVGQAFHWFDAEAALVEIWRVLRPAGTLALVWNTRVVGHPVQQAVDELLAPHRTGVPLHQEGRWRAPLERSPLFGEVEERAFENVQRVDADGLTDRVASISFVAMLGADERASLLARVRELVGDEAIALPYRTEVQLCARR